MKDRIMDWLGKAVLWLFERSTKNPIVYYAIIFAIICLMGYGGWHLKRWANWELAYGDDVKLAVCEMVKPEALKDPSVCEDR